MTKVYCVNCIYCGEPKHDDKLETVFVCEKLSQYNDKSDYFSIKKEIIIISIENCLSFMPTPPQF